MMQPLLYMYIITYLALLKALTGTLYLSCESPDSTSDFLQSNRLLHLDLGDICFSVFFTSRIGTAQLERCLLLDFFNLQSLMVLTVS